MDNVKLKRLNQLNDDMNKIDEILKMINVEDNRYRFRKLIFPIYKHKGLRWGHSYGVDSFAYDLDSEDVVAIANYFREKQKRLLDEFTNTK